MSEAKKEEGKKKGGKLPIIIAVVVILAGGGFFMMKKGSSSKKEVPKVELGHGDGAVIEMEEKLYNLADQQTYLRCTLAFHLVKGFDTSHLTKDVVSAVDDAVYMVITSKKPSDLIGIPNIRKLKREIAAAVNHGLHHEDEEIEEEKEEKSSKKKSKKHKEEEEDHSAEESEEPEHPDWDSDKGPVLKVYIRGLALQ